MSGNDTWRCLQFPGIVRNPKTALKNYFITAAGHRYFESKVFKPQSITFSEKVKLFKLKVTLLKH